jgi:hypothetical protein
MEDSGNYGDFARYTLETAIQKAVRESSTLPMEKSLWKYIGRICRVFWDGDATWYCGRIIIYDAGKDRYFVYYADDSTVEWVDFNAVGMIINEDIQVYNSWPVLTFKYSNHALSELKKLRGFNNGTFVEYFGTHQYQFVARQHLKNLYPYTGNDDNNIKFRRALIDSELEKNEIHNIQEVS